MFFIFLNFFFYYFFFSFVGCDIYSGKVCYVKIDIKKIKKIKRSFLKHGISIYKFLKKKIFTRYEFNFFFVLKQFF